MRACRRTARRCAAPTSRAGRHANEGSCVIHLRGPRAGWGYDHATGECAGPIDLIHHATGLTGTALFEEAARQRAAGPAGTVRRQLAARVDHSHEVARILAGCVPLAGLARRAISAEPRTARSRAVPTCCSMTISATSRPGAAGPAWWRVVRDGAGEPTGGIHRTYLLDDGSGKAPPGKKMLGPVAGGSVRLFADRRRWPLGIAEGIETALSAQAIFGVPTWAALSADGLRRWQWPHGVKRVTIFADAGDAGAQAAARSRRAAQAALASPNAIVSPLHGDDFNDDLRHGATAKDYAAHRQISPRRRCQYRRGVRSDRSAV